MLHRFEADTWQSWTAYRIPPTESEEEDFKKALMLWFQESKFASQGIHIEQVVVNLPGLAIE